MTLHLGAVRAMTLQRSRYHLEIEFTGGIPAKVMQFNSERELLAKFDELVEIDERERHDDA